MAVFLLKCKKEEEKTRFFTKEASPSISEIMASFTNGPILTEI